MAELREMPEVTLLPRSTVFGYHDYNFLTINQRLTDHLPLSERQGGREKLWQVRAHQVVLATGAAERPLIFANNDRPGIMLASAVSTYSNRYAVKMGSRAVVFTNNDSAYQSALDLQAAGVEVAAVIDARRESNSEIANSVRSAGISVQNGSVVVDSSGRKRLRSIEVMRLSEDGSAVSGSRQSLACDVLAVSGGWSPVVHLHAQSGARPEWDEALAMFQTRQANPGRRFPPVAPTVRWIWPPACRRAPKPGQAAAKACGFKPKKLGCAAAETVTSEAILPLWSLPSPYAHGRGPKAVRRYAERCRRRRYRARGARGLPVGRARQALHRDGFRHRPGQARQHQRHGRAARRPWGRASPRPARRPFGPTTRRSASAPSPARISATLFDPVRKTAMHGWHEENGALFEDVGQWKRPWYYPRAGENPCTPRSIASASRCATASASSTPRRSARSRSGDRTRPSSSKSIYTNNWMKLEVGKGRYGFMLGEDGMVMDDGVTIRLGEDHFLMHTTTGGAAGVLAWMERWLQTEWPDLEVFLTSVTDHWATAAVVGPEAAATWSRRSATTSISPRRTSRSWRPEPAPSVMSSAG